MATGFHQRGEGLEWNGLVRLPAALLDRALHNGEAAGHVYQMLTPHLPIPAMRVRTREIDTSEDYERAIAWLEPIAHHWQ